MRAPLTGSIPLGNSLKLDRGERLDVTVEHDREVLVEVLRVSARRLPEARVLGPSAYGLGLRDLAESLPALPGERQEDLGLAGRGVEVLPGTRELEVRPVHLRDRTRRCRPVLQQVEVRARGRRLVDARADDRAGAAGDDDGLRRDREDPVVLGVRRGLDAFLPPAVAGFGVFAAAMIRSRSCTAACRVWNGPPSSVLLRAEDVEPGRLALRRARLLARQQVEQPGRRHGYALGADRRAGQIGLEVEELELRGLPDQLRGLLGVVHAGELDHDLVGALLADLGLGHAELVDPVPHDLDRAVEIRRP